MLTVPKLKSGLSGIYLIQNKATKCFYVGGSTCLRNRFRQHKNDLKNNRHKNILTAGLAGLAFGENVSLV